MSHEPPQAQGDADHPGSSSNQPPNTERGQDESQHPPGEARPAAKRLSAERGVAAPQLARLRRQAGLSQAELAARAGVGVATVSRLERGARAHYSTLDLLAAALSTTRARLISKSRQRAKPPQLHARPEP